MPLLILLSLIACKSDPEPEAPTLPDPICNAGTPWSPGETAFRDATADVGLAEITAIGIRFSAVDFDGDGWADLSVRGPVTAEAVPDGARNIWLLRNNRQGGFEDVTESSGILARRDGDLTKRRPGPVWVWADIDGDGDLDVFTGLPDDGSAETEDSELLLNNGDGTFSLTTANRPWQVGADQPYGAAFADVNGDGHVDLWLTNYYAKGSYQQDNLYLNDGLGNFERATVEAGLKTKEWSLISEVNQALAHSPAWSAEACDLNGDGAPELLASSYGRAPNHLWLNDGTGLFTNQSVASGFAFDENVDWSDNESARCWCTLHPGDEDCAGVPAPTAIACTEDADAFRWNHSQDREPFRLGGNSGPTVCADLDNDGDLDLVTTEIVHWDVGSSSDASEILLNDGTGNFTRPGRDATGLVRTHRDVDWNDGDISAEVFDFDNDAWPDIFIGNSDYPGSVGLLYHQDAPLSFSEVTEADAFLHPRAHGQVVADFDRDGDLDLIVGQSPARCDADCWSPQVPRYYENLDADGNFIQLALTATSGSNTAAIGARVRLTAGGVTQTQVVSGGGGQWGDQSDLVLHFGLGAACDATVEVLWPSGLSQSFPLNAGYRYLLVEDGRPSVAE